MSADLISLDWRTGYAPGTDTASPWVSDMPDLSFLLLMLAGLGMIVFGFWRLIFGLRQVKEFMQKIKSKKSQ